MSRLCSIFNFWLIPLRVLFLSLIRTIHASFKVTAPRSHKKWQFAIFHHGAGFLGRFTVVTCFLNIIWEIFVSKINKWLKFMQVYDLTHLNHVEANELTMIFVLLVNLLNMLIQHFCKSHNFFETHFKGKHSTTVWWELLFLIKVSRVYFSIKQIWQSYATVSILFFIFIEFYCHKILYTYYHE